MSNFTTFILAFFNALLGSLAISKSIDSEDSNNVDKDFKKYYNLIVAIVCSVLAFMLMISMIFNRDYALNFTLIFLYVNIGMSHYQKHLNKVDDTNWIKARAILNMATGFFLIFTLIGTEVDITKYKLLEKDPNRFKNSPGDTIKRVFSNFWKIITTFPFILLLPTAFMSQGILEYYNVDKRILSNDQIEAGETVDVWLNKLKFIPTLLYGLSTLFYMLKAIGFAKTGLLTNTVPYVYMIYAFISLQMGLIELNHRIPEDSRSIEMIEGIVFIFSAFFYLVKGMKTRTLVVNKSQSSL